MTSSREGLESCSDSHVHCHCANGCESGSGNDRGDDRWSANIHVGDNDDLAP